MGGKKKKEELKEQNSLGRASLVCASRKLSCKYNTYYHTV